MEVSNIVNNSCVASRNNNYRNEQELLAILKNSIDVNKDLFVRANQIDLQRNLGYEIDFNLVDKIISKYYNCEVLIHKERVVNNTDDIAHSSFYTNYGVILVLFDGDFYTMIEMIILGLLTHNTMIFAYDDYMSGSNGLLLSIVSTFLEKQGISKDSFQHIDSIDDSIFNNYKSINKTVIIGDNSFINKYSKKCNTCLTISGYKNYDIYLDTSKYLSEVKEIISSEKNISLFVNSNIECDIEEAIIVNDIDEAITMINYNSSLYSTSIFTEDEDNASKFVKTVNSKNIYVNIDPTKEQELDIKQEDLLKEKNVIIPKA